MNFLAPWFLLGALAVALPVVFHLIRRTTRERTRFSSLLLLRPVPPRLTQRNRLEHLLLLCLRGLVLALLALGFARPFLRQFFPETPATGPVRQTVVLVDTSASMRRGNLWAQATAKADEVFRRAAPADQIALLTFDRPTHPRVTFEQWNGTTVGDRAAFARGQLAAVSPGWAATQLDSALMRAGELLTDTDEAPAGLVRQIVVITDLQQGSQLGGLQAYEWPRGVSVVTERLTPPATSNAGVQWLPAAGTAGPDTAAVRLRVSNAADATREQFKVGWAGVAADDWLASPVDVYVPPGQARIVSLNVPSNALPTRVRLTGDDEAFDNAAFVLPPEAVKLTVLDLGREPADDLRAPRYFLARAFQDTPGWTVERSTDTAGRISPDAARAASFAVVTRPLTAEDAPPLRDLLARGRTVLFVPPDAAAAGTLSRLVDGAAVPAVDHQPANYALLGEVDFRHPVFAPFADVRFSDFTKIHFWKHRRFELGARSDARVLARFDSGDPALFELPAGAGRVVVLASGWHPADSQLALSSKFVPLLHGLFEASAGMFAGPGQHTVGDVVPLAVPPGAASAAVAVTAPDGAVIALEPGGTNFTAATLPGVYTVAGGATPARFVVNLAAAESRTAPLPADELERLGVPVPGVVPTPERIAARQVQLQNGELEGRQKLWRWFLAATLAVLLLETWLAGRTARREAATGEMAA
jgi:hypothetical protein